MRFLRGAIDCAVVVTAIGALGVALAAHREGLSRATAIAATQAALARLSCEIGMRESLGTTELNAQGHPIRIERGWFEALDEALDGAVDGAVDAAVDAAHDDMPALPSADQPFDNATNSLTEQPDKSLFTSTLNATPNTTPNTPINWLSNARAPWIEYALPGELSRDHPRVPTFRGGRGAMFWYNPARGVIRARVPESASDEASRALYAEVNGVDWE